MTSPKVCGECALRSQDGVHCGLTSIPIDPKKDFCSKFTNNPQICEICHGIMIDRPIITYENNKTHLLCENCLRQISQSCRFCKHLTEPCKFETDPSPIPPTVKNGERNPLREEVTCKKGCGCFDSANGCMRLYGQGCARNISTL